MVSDGRGQVVTPAQQSKAKVTPAECAAMKLLYAEGYSQPALAGMFEHISKTTVQRHVSENCTVHTVPNHD